MIAIAILIPVLTLIVKLVDNLKKWRKEIEPNKKKEWMIMAGVNIPTIIIFTMESSLAWYYAATLSGFMIAFFLWVFFDGLYNVVRKFNFFFTGTDDPADGVTDDFLELIPLWLHILIKVGGLATLITLYIFFK